MRDFERLQNQVADGTLRMIHVEAVPRSVSTALARALNEFDGPSVYALSRAAAQSTTGLPVGE